MSINKNKISGLKTNWPVSSLVLLMAMINCRTYDVAKYYTPLKFNEGVPKMKVVLANYMDEGNEEINKYREAMRYMNDKEYNYFISKYNKFKPSIKSVLENSIKDLTNAKHDDYQGILLIKPKKLTIWENASMAGLHGIALAVGILFGVPAGWDTCEAEFKVDIINPDSFKIVQSYKIKGQASASLGLYFGYSITQFRPLPACSGAIQRSLNSIVEKINADQNFLNKELK